MRFDRRKLPPKDLAPHPRPHRDRSYKHRFGALRTEEDLEGESSCNEPCLFLSPHHLLVFHVENLTLYSFKYPASCKMPSLLDSLRQATQVDCDTLDCEVAKALGPFVDCTSNQVGQTPSSQGLESHLTVLLVGHCLLRTCAASHGRATSASRCPHQTGNPGCEGALEGMPRRPPF